jgi:hypothetical protein
VEERRAARAGRVVGSRAPPGDLPHSGVGARKITCFGLWVKPAPR